MKHPVIYIKNKGNHIAYFSELTDGQMRIVSNISEAMDPQGTLRTGHGFILYEQRNTKNDCRNIRFLHSSLPMAGILLITDDKLSDQERQEYIRSGVNCALPGNISREEFLQTIHFMSDYAFSHKPVSRADAEVRLFRMPFWKRSFDVVASLSAILLLSPVLIATAIAIRLDSPGPVIYKSKRVGSNYRVFDFLKFRSMRTDADKRLKDLGKQNQYAGESEKSSEAKTLISDDNIDDLLAEMEGDVLISDDFIIPESDHLQQVGTEQKNAFVKIENDPRITRLGRFIRRYSIDELPQLFNILRGDMSVVGNRPLPLYEAEHLTSDEYIERFMCPSGLTGLWQVEKRGQGGKLSPEQRKQFDITYAQTMSPWLDLKIILRTFTAFIQKENV